MCSCIVDSEICVLEKNEHLKHVLQVWLKDEPNDGLGNEDCIELNYQRDQPGWSPLKSWNDRLCSEKIKGICGEIGFILVVVLLLLSIIIYNNSYCERMISYLITVFKK